MRESQRDFSGAVLAVCAVAVTVLLAYRTFAGSQTRVEPTSAQLVEVPADAWRSLLIERQFVGADSPTVRIVEFVDFECPACRGFVTTLDSVLARYPRDVAAAYAHFPLSYHRFAIPAARAADCAGVSGHFYAMGRVLLLGQDSLGLLTWRDYAARAGVSDLEALGSCTSATGTLERVEKDRTLAAAMGVRATPTLLINGLRLEGVPPLDILDSIILSLKEKQSLGESR